MSMFQRAQRRRTWMKLALIGASGSGKTYSALRLAAGLGGRIAVLDTENGSASLYAELTAFDTCELAPPYTVEAYKRVIHEAAQSGYQVLIIDSLSHAWAGEGGLLQQKEALDRRQQSGNQFANWQPITRMHEELKAAILHSPIHIIATMRAKADYVLETVNGRQVPRKVGLAAVQREGLEYEFSIVFQLSADTLAITDKDRTGLFAGHHAQLAEEHGRRIATWLESGADATAPAPVSIAPTPPAAEPPPTRNLPEPESERERLTRAIAQEIARSERLGIEVLRPKRNATDAELAEWLRLQSLANDDAEAAPGEEAPAAETAHDPRMPWPEDAPCSGCGAALTTGQRSVSIKAFNKPLCPSCQKQVNRTTETPAAPSEPQRAASKRAAA